MSAVDGAVRRLSRTVGRAATMTTEAAGALGGAAVNGVVGGVRGASTGVQRGLSNGSHSTPAAALALGALGVAGLVEWPVLVTVGGAALALRQLNRRPDDTPKPVKTSKATKAAPVKAAKSAKSPGPRRSSPRKKQTAAARSRSTSRGTQPRARQ
jgi:hypothetical protein